MRFIFAFLLVLVVGVCFGQEYRNYSDSTGRYLVQYDIPEIGVVTMPLVGYAEGTENPNKPHYDALVTVYRIQKCRCIKPEYDTTMVGKSFRGQYVEGGCFEDRPEDMVNHAKKLQSEMKKPKE